MTGSGVALGGKRDGTRGQAGRRLFGLGLVLAAGPLGLAGAAPVQAQGLAQGQPAPPAGQTLNASLARLARDPRDLAALIDAGNAALQMGDVDAAIGFFARADQLSPNNMRVKAGLAGALVRSENPYDAIPLFAEAERAGAVDPMLAADRGLAYDLVGDTANAQRYYRQALSAGPNDEARRRLALSQAIAGDRKGMEASLSPLLQRQDKAAWRARAFGLAILGAPEEAVSIANQTMPADIANGIAPYLRFMPRLTPAQQAAAANLGRFPRAADIGRDDPRVAAYAPARRVGAAVGAGLVPSGEPLGRARARSAETRPPQRVAAAAPTPAPARPAPGSARAAPPDVAPTRTDVPPPAPKPVVAASAGRSPAPAPARVAVAAPGPGFALTTAPAPAPVTPAARPATATTAPNPAAASSPTPASSPPAGPGLVPGGGFDLARVGPSAAAPPMPAASPAPTPPPAVAAAPAPNAAPSPAPKPRPRSLADAFADLAVIPASSAAPAPGAVDVRRLAAARPTSAKAAEAVKTPPKPVHPSRIWVQVGTGRDTDALGFTWRALTKDNPALFKGQSPSITDWGRTNRLLAGPFASEAAAGAFLAKARKADLDAFVWTSPAGQPVDPLPRR